MPNSTSACFGAGFLYALHRGAKRAESMYSGGLARRYGHEVEHLIRQNKLKGMFGDDLTKIKSREDAEAFYKDCVENPERLCHLQCYVLDAHAHKLRVEYEVVQARAAPLYDTPGFLAGSDLIQQGAVKKGFIEDCPLANNPHIMALPQVKQWYVALESVTTVTQAAAEVKKYPFIVYNSPELAKMFFIENSQKNKITATEGVKSKNKSAISHKKTLEKPNNSTATEKIKAKNVVFTPAGKVKSSETFFDL
jgi:hypothetical protein